MPVATIANRISEEQLAAWRAFLRAHSTMLRRIARDLDEAGLPPLTWYDVLAAVRDAPEGKLKQTDLADKVLLSHSGLSRLLDRIEKKGLVRRLACPGDRRSFHIELTDEGHEMLHKMWPVYAQGIIEDFLPAMRDPYAIRAMMDAVGRGHECDPFTPDHDKRAEAAAAMAGSNGDSP